MTFFAVLPLPVEVFIIAINWAKWNAALRSSSRGKCFPSATALNLLFTLAVNDRKNAVNFISTHGFSSTGDFYCSIFRLHPLPPFCQSSSCRKNALNFKAALTKKNHCSKNLMRILFAFGQAGAKPDSETISYVKWEYQASVDGRVN